MSKRKPPNWGRAGFIQFDIFGPRDLEIRVPRVILRRLVSWMSQKDGKVPKSEIFRTPVCCAPVFVALRCTEEQFIGAPFVAELVVRLGEDRNPANGVP